MNKEGCTEPRHINKRHPGDGRQTQAGNLAKTHDYEFTYRRGLASCLENVPYSSRLCQKVERSRQPGEQRTYRKGEDGK